MKFYSAILLACFALCASADLRSAANEVDSNRTPKTADLFSNACDECQMIVKRIAEIADDPTKIGELKMLLEVMCHEAPKEYQTECHLFVAYVDKFIKELGPYLHNPHAVCHTLHICGNSKLERFHRIGKLFAKQTGNAKNGARDLICEECQFASNEVKNLIEKKETQEEVNQFLAENICSRLGHYENDCKKVLNLYMADFWAELEIVLQDPQKVCQYLKLCEQKNGITEESNEQLSGKSTPRKISNRIINYFLKQ